MESHTITPYNYYYQYYYYYDYYYYYQYYYYSYYYYYYIKPVHGMHLRLKLHDNQIYIDIILYIDVGYEH